MKKWLSVLLSLCLLLSVFPALAELEPDVQITGTPETYAKTDLSKEYTVYMYLIGDKPNDWAQIEELVNDYLKPFNTRLSTQFMSWSDYQTMYPLVLTSGDQVDLIFTAPWCYMYTEAAKGSFYTLTEDFVKDYMPLSAQYQAPISWDETTLSGNTIAVPSNVASPMGKIVAIRQDLAEKYGITSLETWDDFMNYMVTIAEKETPESGIYAMAASGSNPELWDIYRQRFDGFYGLQDGSISMLFKFDGETIPTKDDLKLTYEYPEFREFCKDMKKLADAGCWSRSALTNTISDDDAFAALQGAAIDWNASVFTYMKSAEKNEGVRCMAYDLTKDTFVSAEAYSNNDMAIAAASRNPERAAMVLDLIKYDTYLNRLLLLGVEGVHYSINNATGEYTKLEKNGDYPPLSVSVSWAVKNGNLTESGTPERELVITDSWAERVKSNPTVTFVFDDSEISEYVSAVNSVLGEYTGMLQLGLVDDVDKTIDEMLSRIYDAGMQEVYDEFYRQYEAWYQTR